MKMLSKKNPIHCHSRAGGNPVTLGFLDHQLRCWKPRLRGNDGFIINQSFFKIILSACTLLIMSGCTGYGVTFQTAPSTELASCHQALVGDWRIIEGERVAAASTTDDFLSVNADCSEIYSITSKEELGKKEDKVDNLKNSKDYRIQFSSNIDYDYVVVTPKETSFDITPDIKLPSGKIIYQINKGKDGVILRPIDLDKTIKHVLDRKISGQIFIDRHNPGGNQAANVYVRGDEKQIAAYLNTLDIYSDNRLLLVQATPTEVKRIRKSITQYAKREKSK